MFEETETFNIAETLYNIIYETSHAQLVICSYLCQFVSIEIIVFQDV